ncbi:alpha/beta hydrolase [Rhodococcus fascians]|uniref:alpha/beta fold hydrolase n=1 Tax=Rhodococcoides fascians TaxID=1828 RepID=UPI00195FA62D|nr:alpha/beta hydrolase [Rhodococcus fascians]MBM7245010.1 alpha/beta hydrolase [Rhodococcus fascians]MBY3810943.1 alpha/beta hydrolase [Rhodococcus fascians]MBY3842144.1 alpha/beta hydrolase [Rhodococcus fascians]MBY3847982.1 alpha/beta hydrolase [Rhodococcus fascians]MBY3852637.1 alpha/beta hydrolase [Rhodococcus fascians]
MVGRLLFVHGAGGYVDDTELAQGMAEALRLDLVMPELSDSDMGYEAWAVPVRKLLDDAGPADRVVAHSFGATIVVRVLAEAMRAYPEQATLLAMPDWSPQGWGVAQYALTGEPRTDLTLLHCRDDEVVPVSHLALNSAALPSATVIAYPSGGHQFVGVTETIVADIR